MASLGAAAGLAVLLVGVLAPVAVANAAPPTFPRAHAVSLETTSSGSSFSAISCSTATSCTAVGEVGATGSQVALIYVEASGGWRSVTAPTPVGSATIPDAALLAVDCASPGSCVAVGSYANSTSGGTTGQQALIEVESGGTWSTVAAPMPSNANPKSNNTLDAVSCASPGNCVTVGNYTDSNGNLQALMDVESSGVWSTVAAPLPTGASAANANNHLAAVSCTSNTDCVAVGDYVASAPGSACPNHACQLALLDVEAAGTWVAQVAPVPSDASAAPATGDVLSAVTCPSTGSCVTGGSYVDKRGNNQVLLDVETSGTWAAVTPPLPADASTAPNTNALLSVSCTGVGSCVAVGQYDDTIEYPEGLIENDVGGVWSATTAPTPSDARFGQPDISLDSVSCVPTGGCSAVGTYVTSLGDLHPRALLDTQLGGVWTAGYVELPYDASAATPYSELAEVDCTTPTTCVAVGLYVTSSGVPAVLLDQWSAALTTIPVSPTAPTNVIAAAGNAQAKVSWTASSSDGGSPITGYTVTARPGGASCTTLGGTTCRVWPLAGNTSYTFAVTAQNALGSSPESAATRGILIPSEVTARSVIDPFEPNSSVLTAGLSAEVAAFSQRIAVDGGTKIFVVGYSDNVASPRTSLLVSRRRALAVTAALRHQFGMLHIAGVTIAVSELGSANPVASNTTPAGRAKNRRVVITLR